MQVTDEMVRAALAAYNEALSELPEKSPEPMSLDDIREAGLRAAFTAALAHMWRPIEEAPKDGRYLVVARFKQDELKWLKHSRWMTAAEAAENEGGEEEDFEPGWTDGEDEDDYCYPTHFADILTPPLHSPPKAEG